MGTRLKRRSGSRRSARLDVGAPESGYLDIEAARARPGRTDGDGPHEISIEAEAVVEIQAAAEGDKPAGPPRIKLKAHNFKPVRLGGWWDPVIVAAEGMRIRSQRIPIRMNHDSSMGVGHTESIALDKEGLKLTAEGVVSRDTEHSADFVSSSKLGFPWQASIGASVDRREYVEQGKKVSVNGREYTGPIVVVWQSTLNEISVVDLGADDRTSAKVAAEKRTGQGAGSGEEEDSADDDRDIPRSPSIVKAKTERDRRSGIEAAVSRALALPGCDVDRIEEIRDEAIESGASVTDLEIRLLRETRAVAPKTRRSELPTQKVIEASLCLSAGISDERLAKDRDYGPDVTAAAYPYRNRGLRGNLAAALEAAGHRVPYGNNELFEALRDASRGVINAQQFSTINIPGIIGNTANKMLLDAFTLFPATYPIVAQQADFANFHLHTIYRLDHLGEFEEVGPGGELKHGSLGETSYTSQLKTHGQVIALTRQAIINDDLNAFRTITTTLARKARIRVEKALYDAMMESVDSFYTSARGNRLTSNPLGIAGLGTAEAALLGMADSEGEPIYAVPRYLVVPPGLKALADQIFTSTSLNETTTANAGRPMDNPFKGRFAPVTSPYLAVSSLDGYSATAWYMLADPEVVPAFQVAYLDGRRQPTVETADTSFDTLGMQMRCYFDFGVAQIDYRGAIKSTA